MTDKFAKYRQDYKGVFIATKDQNSISVVASAMDYKTLEQIITQKNLGKRSIAIQYLEPKKAICAYGVSISY